jgi:hypothetical protein
MKLLKLEHMQYNCLVAKIDSPIVLLRTLKDKKNLKFLMLQLKSKSIVRKQIERSVQH